MVKIANEQFCFIKFHRLFDTVRRVRFRDCFNFLFDSKRYFANQSEIFFLVVNEE